MYYSYHNRKPEKICLNTFFFFCYRLYYILIKYIMKPKFRLRLKNNISNTEADNCKQKVLKLHPDTKTKAKVVKALSVAKEEELSRAVKYCQDKNV